MILPTWSECWNVKLMIPKRCTLKFWIRTNAPLQEIAEKLQKARVISDFQIDYENDYEWFVTKPIDHNVELNVSRLHHDFRVPRNEPLDFVLIDNHTSYSQPQLIEWTYKVAHAVCKRLDKTVEIGEIKHSDDDGYLHIPSENISPD